MACALRGVSICGVEHRLAVYRYILMLTAVEGPRRMESAGKETNCRTLASCASGRLNSLQRTMLQWNSLHPYNAVHVVRIPETLDMERLREVINGTLEALGLTGLTLNRDKGAFCYRGGGAPWEIKSLPSGGDPLATICAETEQQLNSAFAESPQFNPFRFFVAATPDSFFLGLTYFHALADAESILVILKHMVESYLGRRGQGYSTPIELYPPCWDRLLSSHPRALVKKLISLPALVRDMRSSCRPKYHDPMDLTNRFTHCSISARNLNFLVLTAKSLNVTVNDLFLALLMKCISTLASARARSGRRSKISVGCIVNVRKDLGADGRGRFGVFLGSFLVTHEVPNEMNLALLADFVRRQTLRIKRDKLYLAASVELGFARFMLRWFSPERRKKLYQKNYPLWGGITNMNLNSLWPQENSGRQVDYLRAVSTGPATPLVLSVTTVGQAANLGITYRQTVFSAADIQCIRDCFEEPRRQLGVWA